MKKLFEDRKGIETMPFYFILSALILVLSAAIILPAYGRWQENTDLSKAQAEAAKVAAAAESVLEAGDVGSTQQTKLTLPAGYAIRFGSDSIMLTKNNATIKEHAFSAELRYRGAYGLEGPGEYALSVVHWVREDETLADKEYLLEVLDA